MTHFLGHRNKFPCLAKRREQVEVRRKKRMQARRRSLFASNVQAARPEKPLFLAPIPEALKPHGYDPELLYVECGRCGAPVMWEKGRATRLLEQAGIDSLELDASCLLVTDACPMCTGNGNYTVQIFRVSGPETAHARQAYGTA